MATVFLAEELKHHRKVAIKVLDPDLSQALGEERFLREIAAAATLTHPHILPLHDSGEADGLLYYVMPYVEGESLRDRLDREGQLPLREAIRITLEVAKALGHAHDQGLVHRDVKPGNILLESGQAVLADFGLAQAVANAESEEARITQTGVSVGTPAYMSPEQASGDHKLDGRSDQYSLACILYEMLAGEPAFAGPNPQAILAKKVARPPPPITLLRPSVPTGVEEVLGKALNRTVADRFPSMEAFTAALEAAEAAPSAGSRPGPHPLRKWRIGAGILTLAAVAVLTVGWVLGWFVDEGPPWGDGYPSSIAVLPFHTQSSSDEERELAVEAANLIARELDWWDEVRALGSTALSGIIHDLGVTEPTFGSSRAALRVAKEAGVEGLLGVTVSILGDSALVEATLFDASTGELVGQPTSGRTLLLQIGAACSHAAAELLSLSEDAPGLAGHGTRSLTAFRHYLKGRDAFFRSDFTTAKEQFTQALDLDEGYGPARQWLGLTHYWDAVEGGGRMSRSRPEIVRNSTLALEAIGSLSGPDSLHVVAFFSFQRGDFEQARRLYARIVEEDPRDALAWLMVGEVELKDLWMEPNQSGVLRPRMNLNLARSAFATATEVRPTFELAYARSLSIVAEIDRPLRSSSCRIYGALRGEFIPPPVGPGAEQGQSFCAVFRDSVLLIPKDLFDSTDPATFQAGADRLFDGALRMLDAWEQFSPDSPRPKEFIADALIRRQGLVTLASPERLEAMWNRALGYAEAALSLRTDTTPARLFQLANLRLAAGLHDAAGAAAEDAWNRFLSEPDSLRSALQPDAANVFLARGQIEQALEVVTRTARSAYFPDPETGELISYAGAEPVLLSLQVLGAGGVSGDPVSDRIARLDSIWDAAGHSSHQKQVLKDAVTLRIAQALVQDSTALETWGKQVDLDTHLWAALGLRNDQTGEGPFLEAAEASLDRPDRISRTFLLAWRARKLGDLSLSIRLYSRLDSIPGGLGALDTGWGLKPLSHLLRGEILERAGELDAAVQSYQRFLELWAAADESGTVTLEAARTGLRRTLSQLGG